MILSDMGFNVTAIIASLGIGGLAIGLAAKDFAAALTVLLLSPEQEDLRKESACLMVVTNGRSIFAVNAFAELDYARTILITRQSLMASKP